MVRPWFILARSSLPRGQRENVVSTAECNDYGSNPVQGTIFFVIFIVCDLQGLLLINPRNIISNIIIIFNTNSTRGQTRFLFS